MINFGPIPDGLFVLHKCDNGKCVRPDHLFLGTQADNIQDMWNKGRQRVVVPGASRGSKNANSKLTWPIVKQIRRRAKLGESGASLGREFRVTKESIYNIINNRNWVE